MSIQVCRDILQLPQWKEPISLVIGNFDGLHLGHRALFKESLAWSRQNQGITILMTFRPHPMSILKKGSGFSQLFDDQDLIEQLEQLGVTAIFFQEFSESFAHTEPFLFLAKMLLGPLRPRHLVIGDDFRFGHNRQGDVSLLKQFCLGESIELSVVGQQSFQGKRISSTWIRELLQKGDCELTASILGRYYYLRGEVVHGEKRGQTIGFPTANLSPTVPFRPAFGVYWTETSFDGKSFQSVTNVGMRPTFQNQNKAVSVESHLLDFQGDLYSRPMKLEFKRKIRNEIKFKSAQELISQIRADIAEVRSRIPNEGV